MKITQVLIPVFILMASACCKKGENPSDCIANKRGDCLCTQEYAPVCGCDGKNYGNKCEAECAGVKTYTAGECSK